MHHPIAESRHWTTNRGSRFPATTPPIGRQGGGRPHERRWPPLPPAQSSLRTRIRRCQSFTPWMDRAMTTARSAAACVRTPPRRTDYPARLAHPCPERCACAPVTDRIPTSIASPSELDDLENCLDRGRHCAGDPRFDRRRRDPDRHLRQGHRPQPDGRTHDRPATASREPALNPPTMAIPHNKTATPSVNTVRIRRDSEETAIEDTAAPIRDRHGMVCGTVIVFHDVGMTRAGAHAVDSPIDTLTHPSRPASGRDGICRRSVSRSTIE